MFCGRYVCRSGGGLKKLCNKNNLRKRQRLDVEKAYNKTHPYVMRQVLQNTREDGHLLRLRESIYKESKACMRVGREEGKYFPRMVDLGHDCMMSMMEC